MKLFKKNISFILCLMILSLSIKSFGQATTTVSGGPNYNGLTELNPNGGSSTTNGIKVQITGGGLIQIVRNTLPQVYQFTYGGTPTAFQRPGGTAHGFTLAIGGNVYMASVDGGVFLSPYSSSYPRFTMNISNIVGHTVSTDPITLIQKAKIDYRIVDRSLTYNFSITYSWNPLIKEKLFIDINVNLPVGHPADRPVKMAMGWDTLLGATDDGPSMEIGKAPYIMMGTYSTKTPYFQMFGYVSGQEWSGYYAGRFDDMTANIPNMVFSKFVDPTIKDTGMGISYDFGSTANTSFNASSFVLFACNAARENPRFTGMATATTRTITGTCAAPADLASGYVLRNTAGSGYTTVFTEPQTLRFYDSNYNVINQRLSTDTTPLIVPSGTYYVAYYDATNDCSSPFTTVTVTQPDLSTCFCYKAPTQTTGGLNPIAAISTIANRNTTANWQNGYKGADMVVESKGSGFVLNRLTQAQITAIPAANLVEGMVVYNTDTNTMQIYVKGTVNAWKEFRKQVCPN